MAQILKRLYNHQILLIIIVFSLIISIFLGNFVLNEPDNKEKVEINAYNPYNNTSFSIKKEVFKLECSELYIKLTGDNCLE